MKFIVRPRRGGKTFESARWVLAGAETNSYPFWTRVLLVHSVREADRIRRQFGLDYRQVFTVEEWRRACLGSQSVEVAIDNVDLILREWLGPQNRLALVTWNED